jgi:uncharacterized damage-inducible protein DinB
MDTREYFIERWKTEHPATVRVMRAVPSAKLDYRPHAKARSAGELAQFLVYKAEAGVDLCEKGEIHWNEPRGFQTIEELIEQYERNYRKLAERLEKLEPAMWERKAKIYAGGQPVLEKTVGEMLWGMLFDDIHHRGQLSAYLRPMGAKVPSIYGPSADDPGK